MDLYDDLPEVGEGESGNSGGACTASGASQSSSTSTQAAFTVTENTKGGKPVGQKAKALSWAQKRHASMLAARRAAAAIPASASSGNQPSLSMTPALLGSNAVGSTPTVSCW